MMEANQKKTHDIGELDQLYLDAESCDQEIFAEMRSNLLLISGEHWNRRNSNFFRRIRDNRELNEQQKLRLTKNHVANIHQIYCNHVLSQAPSVGFAPRNESEMQDQKAAELDHSVWRNIYDRASMDEKFDDWCDSMNGIGEVACKIFWDPDGGELIGYNPKVDPDGTPVVYEDGSPAQGDPVYSGGFVYEEIYGFNLLRDPNCKEMRKSQFYIIRKMVDIDHLLEKYGDNPEIKSKITESRDDTMTVFDATKNQYRKAGAQCMVREFYFRPCRQYPEGQYFITVKNSILEQGTLPGGIFPIVWGYLDKIQTTPRGRGIVKRMRPYQAEINRAASKIAEHQVTLGDDKILIQNGTQVSQGVALPGVRAINFTGMTPTILAGRDGSQYLAYMQAQIAELYQIMNVQEIAMDGDKNSQVDPLTLLFRSATQKVKFQRYVKRFSRFVKEIATVTIQLAKIHLPDDAIVRAVGKCEQVNISEFKQNSDIFSQVEIDEQSEDIETKFGRQIMVQNLIQYAGNKLDKEDIGKLIRLGPYVNKEEGFTDLTLDYDISTNDILALDRGERPDINEFDNHAYLIKKLVSRMRKADFKFLPQEIQQNYSENLQVRQQLVVEQQDALRRAEQGFIPTSGYLVGCDMYVPIGNDPEKTRRARLPYDALIWLIQQLDAQGQNQQMLEQMNQGALTQMAGMLQNRGGTAPNGMGGLPPSGPTPGTGMPGGEMSNGRPGVSATGS
jgi:hypothetical protein